MASLETRQANASASIGLSDNKVTCELAVVATVVHFEAISVEEHILVNGVVAGTVVIVNSLSCAVIRKDKVTADESLRRFKAWNLWHVCEKSLSFNKALQFWGPKNGSSSPRRQLDFVL